MTLDVREKLNLLNHAKVIWSSAQSSWHAYDRAFKRANQLGGALKIGTIIMALLTTLSAYFSDVSALTIVTGLLTALLATVDRGYVPTKKLLSYNTCKGSLEDTKSKLSTFSMSPDRIGDFNDGILYLRNLEKEINNITTREPIIIKKEDRKNAEKDFNKDMTIYRMLEDAEKDVGIKPAALPVKPTPDYPAEDAPGVDRTQRLPKKTQKLPQKVGGGL